MFKYRFVFLTQGDYVADTSKHNGNIMNGTLNPAPEYIPPPPPPLSEEALLLNDNYRQNEDNKFAGKSPTVPLRKHYYILSLTHVGNFIPLSFAPSQD